MARWETCADNKLYKEGCGHEGVEITSLDTFDLPTLCAILALYLSGALMYQTAPMVLQGSQGL